MGGAEVTYVEADDLSYLRDSWVSDVGDLLAEAVASGAALGWVVPPSSGEVAALMSEIVAAQTAGDASLILAGAASGEIVGCGYWRRYQRPTHRPHADLERVVVRPDRQRRGIGRELVSRLVASARSAGVEQLTLDARSDSTAALALYRDVGFVEYGRLTDFVAVGDQRYDKTLWVLDLR